MFRFRGKEGEHEERREDLLDDHAAAAKPGARTLAQALAPPPPREEHWLASHDLADVIERPTEYGATVARRAVIERPLPAELRGQLEHSYGVDLGAVRVVEDGVAKQLGVTAAARGTRLHFDDGRFDPASVTGRWMIAHEVAHVVQQGVSAAAPVERPTLGGSASLEQEAEEAAAAAMAGARARLSRGVSAPMFMGFEGYEHKRVGDMTGRTYELTDGFTLSHGDFHMLNGDFFDAHPDAPQKDNLIVLAKRPSTAPGTKIGTQDEVIAALKLCQGGRPESTVGGGGADPRFAPGGIWEHLVIAPAVMKSVEDRYARLAMKNRQHFVKPIGGKSEYGPGGSAGATYRDYHQRAIDMAFGAARSGGSVRDAMMLEACGQHFLDDSFSTGHLRTPRASLQAYWESVYPDFKANFVSVLGRAIGRALAAQDSVVRTAAEVVGGVAVAALPRGDGAQLGDIALEAYLVSKATETLQATISAKGGAPGLGDLLSSVLHDADNEAGLEVVNDLGWTWQAYGDDNLARAKPSDTAGGRTHFEIIVLAVKLGCDDVLAAYDLGKERADRLPHARGARAETPQQLYAYVRSRTRSPAKADSAKFAPEQLMPRCQPHVAANDVQKWRARTLGALLKKQCHAGAESMTIGDAITVSARGGNLHKTVVEMAATQSTDEHSLNPRAAFMAAVVEPLGERPIAFLEAIIAGKQLEPAPKQKPVDEKPAGPAGPVGPAGSVRPGRPGRRSPLATGAQSPSEQRSLAEGPVGPAGPVQRKATGQQSASDPVAVARRGVAGSGTSLPHLDLIQRSFGRHDVTRVEAHEGGTAADATRALDARAYAVGNSVAFEAAPDLHTAAHEAAHVVQQRRGVQLGGHLDGGAGDPHEVHADAVADAVVAGGSAQALLDGGAAGGGGDVVQRSLMPRGVTGPAGHTSEGKREPGPFGQAVDDVWQSVVDFPLHFTDVMYEYAKVLQANRVKIVAVVSTFMLVESACLGLASTGGGAVLVPLVQAVLASFAGAGALVAGAEAIEEGRQWLDIAIHAEGDQTKIGKASEHFIKMLVKLLMTVLAAAGSTQNFTNAMGGGAGGLAPALATGGSMSTASTAAAVATGGSAVAVASMMTMKEEPGGASEPTKSEASGEKPDTPVQRPNSRHYVRKVLPQKKIPKKKMNTVIEEGVDVTSDVKAINEGKAVVGKDSLNGSGAKTYTVNGRTYSVEENGTLCPIVGEGAGFHRLRREAYQILQILNGNGDRAGEIIAKVRAGNKRITQEDIDLAYKVFNTKTSDSK